MPYIDSGPSWTWVWFLAYMHVSVFFPCSCIYLNYLQLFNVQFSFCIKQLLRPIYKQIAENQNAEIFSANTLLVIFGTSLLTARVRFLYVYFLAFTLLKTTIDFMVYSQAGLSMALGAFLAGLLLAETEFSLQVESDIAPYRGLLLGLFFMTVSTVNIIALRIISLTLIYC
jgi:Kef-type K+ transport system membrane component KefB